MFNKYTYFLLLGILILFTGLYSQSKASQIEKEEVIEWKVISTYDRSNQIYQNGIEKFAKDINEFNIILSDKGREKKLKIVFYAVGEYQGIKADMVYDAVRNGTVEMGFGDAIEWSNDRKPGSDFMYAVPFGLNAEGMYAWLYRGGGLELWMDMYKDDGVIPFPIGNIGGAMGGWFEKEINDITNFEGLKIRTTGIQGKVMRKCGADEEWMQANKALDAYKNGEVDVLICLGPYSDSLLKFNRGERVVAGEKKQLKYYYYPGWQEPGGVFSLIINKQTWDKLEVEQKEIFEIARSNTYRYIYNQFETMNAIYLQEIYLQPGIEIKRFPDHVLDDLRKKTEEVFEEEAQKDKQFKRIYEAFKKFRETSSALEWRRMLDGSVPDLMALKFLKEINNQEIFSVHLIEDSVVISLSGDQSFASSSGTMQERASKKISGIAEIIGKYSRYIKLIRVEGYGKGKTESYNNWKLSKRRADGVVKLLTKNGKVKPSLIKPAYYGDTDTNTESKRVEIIIEF